MASIFSHPAVPVGIALALGQKRIPRPLLIMGILSTMWADFDCAGFAFGIKYESQWGHRGFTHSIFMAAAFAALIAWRLPMEKGMEGRTWKNVFPYIFACALSHPLIDMLTDGGLGIALFWPFTAERFFFPVNPIPVSPIGGSFLSARGLHVFLSEVVMLWLPCLTLGGIGFLVRRKLEKKSAPPAP